MLLITITLVKSIDQEFVTSTKKFANFNEFSEIKKIRKNSYKNSLNAGVGVAFQQQLKNLMRFTVSC